MTFGRYSTLSVILAAVLLVGACRPDVVPAEATEIRPPLQLVDGAPAEQGAEAAVEQAGGEVVATTLDDDAFGPFGLLAPTVPGLALGTYASSCDPFEDSLGSCL